MELETKLRMQKMKYERKLKNVDEMYLSQIEILTQKVYMSEKSNNNPSYIKEKRSNGRISNLDEDQDLSREVNKIFLLY